MLLRDQIRHDIVDGLKRIKFNFIVPKKAGSSFRIFEDSSFFCPKASDNGDNVSFENCERLDSVFIFIFIFPSDFFQFLFILSPKHLIVLKPDTDYHK